MALDSQGDVLVGHVFSASVSRIELSTGRVHRLVGPERGLLAADDITSDGQGTCWTSCTSALAGASVYRIDASGEVRAICSGLAGANGIHFNRRTQRLFVGQFGAGNGLYEIDPDGRRAPRLITKDFASTNAMDSDAAGHLLVTVAGGRIARVDPDTGAWTLLEVSFPHNSAVKTGPDGTLWVTGYDAGCGMLWRVNSEGTSAVRVDEGRLPPLDNLLVSLHGKLFVSSLRDATVYEMSTDEPSTVLRQFSLQGAPTVMSLAVRGEEVVVNDGLSIRRLDRQVGRLVMTRGSFYERKGFPIPGSLRFAGESADAPLIMAAGCQSSMGNSADARLYEVRITDYAFKVVNAGTYQGVRHPSALCVTPDVILVAEFIDGRLTSLARDGDDSRRSIVCEGLHGPCGMVCSDGHIFVVESLGQRLVRVDLDTGRRDVLVCDGLGRPTAMALARDGRLLVIDSAGRRLLAVDARTGAIEVLADGLPVFPIVLSHWPLLGAENGLAVGAGGEVYVGGNADGSLWCLEPKGASD